MNNDYTIIKQIREDFFSKLCTSHYIVRVRKGLLKVCMWEGAGDRTELQYIDPHSYGRQRCVFLVLQGCSTGGPGAQLSAGWWLSLLHLISNFSGSQLIRAPRTSSTGLLYHHLSSNSSKLQLSDFLSWPSYIIVQRILNRLLDLWNDMFDRHQTEITVMQFTVTLFRCISLWVYHGNFSLSHFVSQFPPTRFPHITVIRMCHFFRCITLEWQVWPGRRSK